MKVAVLFPKIFNYPFTYESTLSDTLKAGDFVRVPFGSSEITGVVWPEEQKTTKKFQIKKISRKMNVRKLNSSMVLLWLAQILQLNPFLHHFLMFLILLNKNTFQENMQKPYFQ